MGRPKLSKKYLKARTNWRKVRKRYEKIQKIYTNARDKEEKRYYKNGYRLNY